MKNITPYYSDGDLKTFEKLLLAKLDDANQEITMLQQAPPLIDNKPIRMPKSTVLKNSPPVSDSSLEEIVQQLILHQRDFIYEIQETLLRIKKRTYGICTQTKQLIPRDVMLISPMLTCYNLFNK